MKREQGMAGAASSAFRFVFMMGIVNLFADMTYEGGASINGPFLATLGAKAAAVSIIAGLGEFLGYSLRAVSLLSCVFSPLVFLGGFGVALAGMMLWGIGYATQDTLFKAIVAGILPEGRRNLGFGLFYTGYGTGWLVGSVATGLLYDRSRVGLIVFSVAIQLASIPAFFLAKRKE